jgi:hypothetical protein
MCPHPWRSSRQTALRYGDGRPKTGQTVLMGCIRARCGERGLARGTGAEWDAFRIRDARTAPQGTALPSLRIARSRGTEPVEAVQCSKPASATATFMSAGDESGGRAHRRRPQATFEVRSEPAPSDFHGRQRSTHGRDQGRLHLRDGFGPRRHAPPDGTLALAVRICLRQISLSY